MAKPTYIELGEGGPRIPILHEDRAALAIDKPAGWLLVPSDWQRTARNLQAAIESSVAAGDFWARSRNLRFLRHVHRLDAETSGVLLLARSPGALDALGDLFETRRVAKRYLCVVRGLPRSAEWTCHFKLMPDPHQRGHVLRDDQAGKDAVTHFRVLATRAAGPFGACALVEAEPRTGRTHQIRVHLAESHHGVLGDRVYGPMTREPMPEDFPLALRAVGLAYADPFTQRPVVIEAPEAEFCRAFGFESGAAARPLPEAQTPATAREPERNRRK